MSKSFCQKSMESCFLKTFVVYIIYHYQKYVIIMFVFSCSLQKQKNATSYVLWYKTVYQQILCSIFKLELVPLIRRGRMWGDWRKDVGSYITFFMDLKKSFFPDHFILVSFRKDVYHKYLISLIITNDRKLITRLVGQ